MSRLGRISATTKAGWHSFLRRRTAVFFTFFFPAIIVVIFGLLVQTQPGDGGLFAEPPSWYIAGYIAVVVLFTPLSRVGSEVSRHRDGSQFEKLATTPLRRWEWLLSQTLVNTTVIGLASLLLLGLLVVGTDATLPVTSQLWLVVPFIVIGTALFCAIGAILGSYTDSRDGVIAASNGLAVPLLFLSEAFVSPDMLPDWLPLELSPMTYLTRGLRDVTYDGTTDNGAVLAEFPGAGRYLDEYPGLDPYIDLAILCLFAVVFFAVAAKALPQTD